MNKIEAEGRDNTNPTDQGYDLRSRKLISSSESDSKTSTSSSPKMTNVVMTQEMLQQLLADMIAANQNASPPAPVYDGNFTGCKS